jgi:4-hydroxythreonine-4-phosphate dehydrogenase
MNNIKPKIGILLGDPSGIGPELISKLLVEDELEKANVLVIGEKAILEKANKMTGRNPNLRFIETTDEIKFDEKTKFFLDITNGRNFIYETSKCSSESGQSVLKCSKSSARFSKIKKNRCN